MENQTFCKLRSLFIFIFVIIIIIIIIIFIIIIIIIISFTSFAPSPFFFFFFFWGGTLKVWKLGNKQQNLQSQQALALFVCCCCCCYCCCCCCCCFGCLLRLVPAPIGRAANFACSARYTAFCREEGGWDEDKCLRNSILFGKKWKDLSLPCQGFWLAALELRKLPDACFDAGGTWC